MQALCFALIHLQSTVCARIDQANRLPSGGIAALTPAEWKNHEAYFDNSLLDFTSITTLLVLRATRDHWVIDCKHKTPESTRFYNPKGDGMCGDRVFFYALAVAFSQKEPNQTWPEPMKPYPSTPKQQDGMALFLDETTPAQLRAQSIICLHAIAFNKYNFEPIPTFDQLKNRFKDRLQQTLAGLKETNDTDFLIPTKPKSMSNLINESIVSINALLTLFKKIGRPFYPNNSVNNISNNSGLFKKLSDELLPLENKPSDQPS